MKSSRSEFIAVRNLRYHVRHWGREGAPKLFMLHGWMDVSASFQFVVDCLQHDWHVIAPDWRGFGLSARSGADFYWFPDYVADLDQILLHYSPQQPVDLLGHSMGGNVACIYAGVRPERINRLVNLEGFGMPASQARQAPAAYRKWLDQLRDRPRLRSYATQAEVALRLQHNNSRLSAARAAFLAAHWALCNEQGRWELLGDPVHKFSSPILYHVEDALACWESIAAPVLWVEAADTHLFRWMGAPELMRLEIDRRIKHLPNVSTAVIDDAGHMLHHDQPDILAPMIERFLA